MRGRFRSLTGLLAGLLVAVMVTGARPAMAAGIGQGYILLSLGGKDVKWGKPELGAPAVIRYAFVTAPITRKGAVNCRSMKPFPARLSMGGVEAPDIFAGFRRAFADWQAVAAVRFEEVTDAEDAHVLLGVQSNPKGIAYADVIQKEVPGPALNPIQSGAICLNPVAHWETGFDGDPDTFDIHYIALHEIGHVIGLDHSWGKDHRVMNFRYTEIMNSLQPGDIAGAVFLYGPRNPNAKRNLRAQTIVPQAAALADERRGATR